MFKIGNSAAATNSQIISNHLNQHKQQQQHIEPSQTLSAKSSKSLMRIRVRGRGISSRKITNNTSSTKSKQTQSHTTGRRLMSASLDDLRRLEPRAKLREIIRHDEPSRKIFSSMIDLPNNHNQRKRSVRRRSSIQSDIIDANRAISSSYYFNQKKSFNFRLKRKSTTTFSSSNPPTANLIFKISRGFRSSAKENAVRF